MARNSISCNWLSPTDLVTDIDKLELNTTAIVAQCENICHFVFRSDDLDLAKQGVRVSILIQALLAILSGTILPLVIYLTNTQPLQYLAPRIPLLQQFRRQIWNTNTFFSLSLLISIITRHHSTPNLPVLETAYLSKLAFLEMFTTYTLYFGEKMHTSINNHKPKLSDTLYVLLSYAQLIVTCLINIPHPAVHKELAQECYAQGRYGDVRGQIGGSDGRAVLTWSVAGVCAMIVIPFSIAMLARISAVSKAWKRVAGAWEWPGWMKRWDIKDVNKTMDVFAAVAFAGIAVLNLRGAEQSRRVVVASSDDRGGFLWDYGQLMAVLVWFPVLWKALSVVKDWRNEALLKTLSGTEVQDSETAKDAATQAEAPPPYNDTKQADIRDFGEGPSGP